MAVRDPAGVSPKPDGGVPQGVRPEANVVLPCTEEHFADFIAGLLGRPQVIAKNVRGSFEIGPKELEEIHQLLMHRVTQQNAGTLMQFTARIVYSDNSSVQLTGVPELSTYNEVRPVVPRAIHLTWDFLLHFRGSAVPQKQQIIVSFVADTGGGVPMIDEDGDQLVVPFLMGTSDFGGIINFQIRHTERTWGGDLEALLTNHIRSLMRRTSAVKRFLWRHSGRVGLAIGLLFVGASMLGAFATAASCSAAAGGLAESTI